MDIVRRQIDYLVNDSDKDSRQKSLELMDLAVRMTHHATLTGDQATLDFFLSGKYIQDLTLLSPSRQQAAITVEEGPLLESSPPSPEAEAAEPVTQKYRITDILREIFPDAPKPKISNLYSAICHSRRYKTFIQSEQNGKRKRHYISGQDLDEFKRRILEQYDSSGTTKPEEAKTPSEKDVKNDVPPPANFQHQTSTNGYGGDDIITLQGLARLLGTSTENIEKRGIPFQKAGTTRYTTVKDVLSVLTDDQRSRLAEYVQ